MPQEPNPVVQVKEISCLPVNTRACSSTRHYTTHSYPQQCGGVSAVRDGVALQRRSSRTGETDANSLAHRSATISRAQRCLTQPVGTSSVHTLKLVNAAGPKVLLRATSAASRPRAIKTLPMRGVL